MNIASYINPSKKKKWTRRLPPLSDDGERLTTGGKIMVLTQDQFLNELSPTAHDVNSAYMSRRPIYAPTGKKDANGKEEWVLTGYDDVETVALGLQECIVAKKISHFTGDGFWVANETTDTERFDRLVSWMDVSGLKSAAWTELVRSVFRTGDGAIYLYQTPDGIDYEVYGYEEGSTLFPGLDDDGNKIVARKYRFADRQTVDLFLTDRIETWMQLDPNGDFDIIPAESRIETSEDGYTLVRRKQSQAGAGRCQCIYFRIDDIPSGPAELSIEALENSSSYMAEEVKNDAFPILFIKSEKVVSLPPTKANGKTIAVKGTSDSLPHADAKFLAPPDASNVATSHVNTLWDNIRRSTMSVFIEPDILKSGADSSTTIKIMFAPEIQWAQNTWPKFFKGVRDMVAVFKALVGKIEQDIAGYESLRLSVGQNVWIPQNLSEAITNETDMVYARIKSRAAAMQDLGSQHAGDYEKVNEEWEAELALKQKYSASLDDDNSASSKTNIDNNAAGKSITE